MERDYNLEKRKYVIGASVIVIVLIYLIRLFTLQIMSEDYKKNADSNAFLNKTQYPSRGVMYDRNGNLLVYNQPAYDVTMVMKEVHNLDTLDLCKTLNITPGYFKKRIREIKDRRSNPGYSPYTHQVFMTQLSAEECGVFQEKLFKFPGFYIQRRTIRQYNYNSALIISIRTSHSAKHWKSCSAITRNACSILAGIPADGPHNAYNIIRKWK